ncbi:MAG TPA: nucleotidyl transferase AbiEii/AbiGii toxin family protein [Polyangiaceae bacterium]|nr:nucleotidyl transferase AbiEii/AbiGii toxin family protein [Polyangiaceae bacterium]
MKAVTDEQRAALRLLAPALEIDTYLAGGVGVAAMYEHRASRDLDLFVPHDFEPERLEERLLVPNLRVTGRARGTLHLEVAGIPASILSYRYRLLGAPEMRPDIAVPVASADDLACMKVSAVAGRGAAKDFWDLEVLLAHGAGGGNLSSLLEHYARKFPVEDIGHAVRSLAYFAEADAAPLPIGLSPDAWRTMKARFAMLVRAL